MSFFGGEGGFQEPLYANPFSQGSGAGNALAYPFMPSQGTKDLLKKQFGVDFPQEIQQNPLLSNATAAAHPLLKLLSGAIMGGALTPGPAPIEGAGQGMSRAMQGILGVPAARRQFQASQIQAPFQMADQVGGFQALDQIKDLRASQIRLNDASAGAATLNAKSRADYDAATAGARQDRIEKDEILRGKPYPAGTDAEGNSYEHYYNKDTSEWKTRMLTGPDGQRLSPAQRATSAIRSGNLLQIDMLLADPKVDKETKAQLQTVVNLYTGQQGTISGYRAGAAQGATEPMRRTDAALKQFQATQNKEGNLDASNRAVRKAVSAKYFGGIYNKDPKILQFIEQNNNLFSQYQQSDEFVKGKQGFQAWRAAQGQQLAGAPSGPLPAQPGAPPVSDQDILQALHQMQ